MLARLLDALEVRAGARSVDVMIFRGDLDVVEPCPLHGGVHRPGGAFDEVYRAVQKITPAPLLRCPVDLVKKPRCQRIGHPTSVT